MTHILGAGREKEDLSPNLFKAPWPVPETLVCGPWLHQRVSPALLRSLCTVRMAGAFLPLRLKGELLLDAFLLLSKLFGRDAEGKRLHLIQRARDQLDPGLTPNPRKKIQSVTDSTPSQDGRPQLGRPAGCCTYSSDAKGFSS